MPKENIYGDTEDRISRIELSWQHGAYVQMTTALRSDEPASTENPGYVAYETGTYVSLNRYGINKLIQHLRRARDAAFGKDE